MQDVKEIFQEIRTSVAASDTERAIEIALSLHNLISDPDISIRESVLIFSSRYNQIQKENILGTNSNIQESLNKLNLDLLEFLKKIEISQSESGNQRVWSENQTPNPSPRKTIWKKYIKFFVGLLAMIIIFLIGKNMVWPSSDIENEKGVVISVENPEIYLGEIELNSIHSFEINLVNKGKADAFIDTITLSCISVKIISALPKVMAPNSSLKILAKWEAEDTLEQQCKCLINGSNLDQALSVIVSVDIKRNRTEPIQAEAGSSKPANDKEVTAHAPPKKEKEKEPTGTNNGSITSVPPQEPEVKLQFVTIRCLTRGIGEIKIWFYDKNGKKYEITSLNGQEDVAFKVPTTLLDDLVKVHYKYKEKGDHREELFSPTKPFEVPRSVVN